MTRPIADQVLGGRYRLTSRIAGGGMGEVWKARDEVLGREVAVKILRREYADDPTFLERFRAEARHTAALSHPNIAAVYDFGEGGGGEEQDSPFLVMEHVRGEPLSAIVAREGSLRPDRTLELVGQAALGLQAAHDAGVIHRDVKPGNILVTADDEVRITDFGISRATDSVPLTQTGTIMGTAFYISPEQASGGSVTPASDIYSLGIVAYECLTGRRPFNGDTPVSVALAQVREEPPALPPELPEPVRALVMRMLAKDPADRPGSAGQLGREALTLAPALARTPAATAVLPVSEPAMAGAAPAPAGRAAHTDTDPGFHLPSPSRLPTWVPYVVGVGLVALLLVLVSNAFGAADTSPGGTAQGATAGATGPVLVDVVGADYLGRPAGEARRELADLGLQVEVARTGGGGPVGTVKEVSPVGSVEAGSLVTLGVVDEAPREDEDQDDDASSPGNGSGKGKAKGRDKNDERDD
ncbi:MAG TPA: serine/threonine-protein kinase [Actinomycetes bacterium]|nr:serine/threonine-protein kinase [Actinomycetes bacterium]